MSESQKLPQDYLKYWRVIRYYYCRKYGITGTELDLLLFLYSEKYFNSGKFTEYNKIMMWDEKRFYKMRENGWIDTFSPKYKNPYRRFRQYYELSIKAKRLVSAVYNTLSGEEIPVDAAVNPLFRRNVRFTDKVYRNMIIKMREATKRGQHPSLE